MEKPARKTNDDAFDILSRLASDSIPVRNRYAEIASLFYHLADKYTCDEDIIFSNLLSRVDHLLKANRPKGRGLMLKEYDAFSRSVHQFRFRISRIDGIADEILQQFVQYDFRTLCRWVSMLTRTPIPQKIESCLPSGNAPEGKGHVNKSYVRAIVDSCDDNIIRARTNSQKMQQINIALKYSETGTGVSFEYLRDVVKPGTQLNIIAPRRDENGCIIADLIILEPDYTIDVTSVAECFTTYSTTPLTHLMSKLSNDEKTEHMLLGNFAGQLLDEIIHSTSALDYKNSVQTFFHKNAADIIACGNISTDFHANAHSQATNISTAINTQLPKLPTYNRNSLLIEPSFFCEMLGLNGRMDLLQADYSILVEQKSGKAKFVPSAIQDSPLEAQQNHYVQAILYQAILHYGFGINNGSISSFLLYSKYTKPLVRISNSPRILRDAIMMRNLITAQEITLAEKGFECLMNINSDDLCQTPQSEKFFKSYVRPRIDATLNAIKNAPDIPRRYAMAMLRFLQTEYLTNKSGFNALSSDAGFAGAWNTPFCEKLAAGNIIHDMTIDGFETEKGSDVITHVHLDIPPNDHDSLPNFRQGDIVVLYSYTNDGFPDIRHSVAIRASVETITKDQLRLRLRAPQTDRRVFRIHKKVRYAVERDFFDSSFRPFFKGIISFLQTSTSRRDLLLSLRMPTTDKSIQLYGDYGAFNGLVLNAKRANDYFIVIGPPGTGKTSHALMNILREELTRNDARLLLMAYTNQAVDEICSNLTKDNLDFLRIGSHLSCDKQWHKYLLSEASEKCKTATQIVELIEKQRIIIGTLHSVTGALPMIRRFHFTTTIIDEASQILEPHLLPLLTARYELRDVIDRFILIGDHKQLPAIVRQPDRLSTIDDRQLNGIGLYNCRNSLFHRLLMNAYDPISKQYSKDVVYSLNRQGRMHPDVARFSSEMFYDSNLKEVPLPHQMSKIEKIECTDAIDAILNSSRMIFVDVNPVDEEIQRSDNANRSEAAIVARILTAIIKRENSSFNADTVGIIVPYRSQIMAIRKVIEQISDPRLKEITIDTVERFQGSQRKYIIYDLTVKRLSQLSFLCANRFEDNGAVIDRKMNVALTRARSHTIVVGNKKLVRRDALYSKLIDFCTLI